MTAQPHTISDADLLEQTLRAVYRQGAATAAGDEAAARAWRDRAHRLRRLMRSRLAKPPANVLPVTTGGAAPGVARHPTGERGQPPALPSFRDDVSEERTSGGTPVARRAVDVRDALRESLLRGRPELSLAELHEATGVPLTSLRRGLERAMTHGWVRRRVDEASRGRRHLYAPVGGPASW